MVTNLGNSVHPYAQAMIDLCNSFPELRGKPGTAPWNQHVFARWASGAGPTSGSRAAAQFVLTVWNGRTLQGDWCNEEGYQVGVFDAVDAISAWDTAHRRAYIAWCMNPFYP